MVGELTGENKDMLELHLEIHAKFAKMLGILSYSDFIY